MKLLDLPAFHWIIDRKDAKVLRHRDAKFDLWALRHEGKFDEYQDGQQWDVFGTAKYLVSFIAERSQFAKFVGVWEVHSKTRKQNGGFQYTTKELPGYSDLAERLVIEWGSGTRSWAQWCHQAGNKQIFELLPPRNIGDFPGLYSLTLSHAELAMMIKNPESNRDWQRMLSSVSGVYLILDKKSGRQYVGSAYGVDGFWARWSQYARKPHGGNQLLIELLSETPDAYTNFQFSILRVLESGATRDEVLAHEAIVKRKLGSRTFGLNCN